MRVLQIDTTSVIAETNESAWDFYKWVILGVIAYFILKRSIQYFIKKKEGEKTQKARTLFVTPDCLSCKIVGLNKQHTAKVGDYIGRIIPIIGNKYDDYAIAVVVKNKQIGWVPAGNEELHKRLLRDFPKGLDVFVEIEKALEGNLMGVFTFPSAFKFDSHHLDGFVTRSNYFN